MPRVLQPLLQPGTRLDEFEIVRLLGRGGMGEVYEARQLRPQRNVALKILAPWLCENADALKRFEHEADVLAHLDDQRGIVQIYTAGRTPEGTAYYAMQLIRGPSIWKLIHDSRSPTADVPVHSVSTLPKEATQPFQPPTAAEQLACAPEDPTPQALVDVYRNDRYRFATSVGIAVARTLKAAHAKGILHRDMKPSNLMIDAGEQIYVVDFGLARLTLPGDAALSLGVRGTAGYMSPEQARGEALDERSDLYSLGVTLYEIASGGESPYQPADGTSEAMLEEVRSGRLKPLRMVAPDIPERLERVIARTTAFAPNARYASAAEMLAELQEDAQAALRAPVAAVLLQQSLDRAAHQTPERSATAPLLEVSAIGPPARRNVVGLLVAATVAACLLALVTVLLLQQFWRTGATTASSASSSSSSSPEPTFWADTPLPAGRKDRAFDVPIALLTTQFEPHWQQRILGDGDARKSNKDRMSVTSVQSRTVLALDDPTPHWFRYQVDVRQMGNPVPGGDELGIFFGYRRNPDDPEWRSWFFVVQLQEGDAGAPGKLLIGAAHINEARAGKAEILDWYRQFRGDQGEVILQHFPADGWRKLEVLAVDDRITITVDGGKSAKVLLDPEELRRLEEEVGGRLDPHGALGVWANLGIGFFRDVSVTALPRGAGAR